MQTTAVPADAFVAQKISPNANFSTRLLASVVRVTLPFLLSLLLIGWLVFGTTTRLRLFSDFGLEISTASMFVVKLGMWATNYWYLLVFVAGTFAAMHIVLEVLTFEQARRRAQWGLFAVLVVFPLSIILLGEYVLAQDLGKLVQDLG